MKFVSLHTHTTHSYLDGYGTPTEHIEKVAELGMNAVAFTEHGNTNSHTKAEVACDSLGVDVKPIYGCELYTGYVDDERKTQRKNHLGILAENEVGYRNLITTVSEGWSQGFHHEPTVSFEMLERNKEGLIVFSGCTASLLSTSLTGGKNVAPGDGSYAKAKKTALHMQRVFGDSYYLECQIFPELANVRQINKAWEQLSAETGIPLVATADVHFPNPEDKDIRQILHAVKRGGQKTLEEIGQEFNYDIPAEYPHDDKWVTERLIAGGMSKKGAEQALANTAVISERCNVRLPKIENLRYPLPAGTDDPITMIRTWITEGWIYRGINKFEDKGKIAAYRERLLYELDLIVRKDFTDYFLVMSDVTKFAKDSGIPVGPARGSAAASLVCYLMRITEVDPMLYPNLLFERFIDINRHDLPDIDLDFDDERRHEIREYLVEKYGEERVGNIGTFTYYRGKNSIDDVARVHNIPKWETDVLKKLLIERSSGDLRQSATIEDTVDMFDEAREVVERYPALREALRLEGNIRGMGIHAAGLVVANGPLSEVCSVYEKKNGKGEQIAVVGLDKHDAEYLNVLKLDILSLKTMGIIRRCIEDVGITLEELYSVDLHLQSVIDAFAADDLVGIFQFDGRAMRNVCRSVSPESFDQICDINALARPGPLHGGATAEYIDVKSGKKEAHSFGEAVDVITEHTFGQVVYQEQILRIVREVGNFTWPEAATIRKIISKKRGEQEFNKMKGKFVTEAPKNGMPKEEAEKLWSMLVTAGAYAFNAAHCVSYGMLAYWTMWLKQNHPIEFFTASLQKNLTTSSSQQSTGKSIKVDKATDLIQDAVAHGIPVMAPSLTSDSIWNHDGERIYAGFQQIKGIGDKTAKNIAAYKKEHGVFENWADLQKVKGVGPKTVELIIEFSKNEDPFGVDFVRNQITQVREWLEEGQDGNILPRPTHTVEDIPYDRGQDVPVTWIGLVQAKNLKELFENHFSRKGVPLDPSTVKSPELNEWVTMYIEDETGVCAANINRFIYPQFRQQIWNIVDRNDVVILKGFKPGFQARKVINVQSMHVLSL
jgi:DNA polymerase-3 subunit alpha